MSTIKLPDALQSLLRPADRALLANWISEQPNIRLWLHGPMEAHQCYILAAGELAKCGLSVSEMTQYALRQVVTETQAYHAGVPIERICHAYAAIHNASACGPTSGGVMRAVLEAFGR